MSGCASTWMHDPCSGQYSRYQFQHLSLPLLDYHPHTFLYIVDKDFKNFASCYSLYKLQYLSTSKTEN